MIYFQINYYEAIIIWNSNILLSFCCYVNEYSTRSLKASEDHERKDMQIWNYSFLWNHYHVPFTLICGLVRLSEINEFKCVTSAIFLWSYLLRIKKSTFREKVNCSLYYVKSSLSLEECEPHCVYCLSRHLEQCYNFQNWFNEWIVLQFAN